MKRLLPGRCVLCGGDRLSRIYPLCAACREECTPVSGSVCGRCGRSLISEDILCTDCRIRGDTCNNRAAAEYRGRLREVIALYKLSGRRDLSSFLADLLVAGVGKEFFGGTVVPVPPSPQRFKRLGWDPVLELLRCLEKPLEIRIRPLLRRFPGPQQKELGYEERLLNAAAVFGLRRKADPISGGSVEGPGSRSVVLFDDIFTTGATVSVCSRLLENAGFEVAGSVTLAVD